MLLVVEATASCSWQLVAVNKFGFNLTLVIPALASAFYLSRYILYKESVKYNGQFANKVCFEIKRFNTKINEE